MTQCVVVLGLLCVEMCLVWSWFGLFFLFFLFSTCTSVLLLFVPLVCLSVNFKLLLRLLFCNVEFLHKYCKCAKHKPSPPRLTPSLSFSFPHTYTHTYTPTYTTTPTNSPHTPQLPLCFAVSVSLQLLTDFLVSLQSRKASEQAKSVDSKTDSIGSGRAIPIKQVSSFAHSYSTFLIVIWVSIILFWCNLMFFSVCCVLKT